ncbi:transposon TX1 [Tanacetum coccineum]|uniref:Transposon TX1 n=1 Tax=Tanacetum coccineum TaxID=301880 RepID=A0ABQ5DZ62_9ASTR
MRLMKRLKNYNQWVVTDQRLRRVHIHTINKGLIREELNIKFNGRVHKISVVEEVHDITTWEIQISVMIKHVSKVGGVTEDKMDENDMQIDEREGEDEDEGSEDEGSEDEENRGNRSDINSDNRNRGEDEGSRYSGEAKVGDTFEADLGNIKENSADQEKDMCGECNANNNSGSTRKEGPTEEIVNNGYEHIQKIVNMKVIQKENESGPNLDHDVGQIDGLVIEKKNGLYGIVSTGPSGKKCNKSNRVSKIMDGNFNNKKHRCKGKSGEDNEMTDVRLHEGSTSRRDKREVSPSSSVESGGDRLKKRGKLSMKRGSMGLRLRRILTKVKEVGELIGVLRLRAKEEKKREEHGIAEEECNVAADIISVNVRGMGESGKKGWIRNIIRAQHPDIIGLQETKERLVFTCKEAIDDKRFVAVKGSWKGKDDEMFLVCSRRFTRVSDDRLKFSKLDRFLLNDEFNNLWGNLSVMTLDRKLSDHYPIMLKDVELDFGPKLFRIFNIWMEEPDFTHVLEEAWKKYVKERFGEHKEKTKKLKNEAMRWKLKAEKRALNDVERETWMEARKRWEEKERERNNKCNLRGLMVNGLWCKDPKVIKVEMARHYKSLYSEYGGIRPIFCCDRLEKISIVDAMSLEDIFSEKEAWDASGLMGFGEKWCKWVDVCLRSTSMSILVNGSPSEEFELGMGVRQGDPLSPFLFILAAEGLNAIVNVAATKDIFRGVKVGINNIMVLHLQQANDTIFFGEWNKENAKSLMCILKCFEKVFGLRVNYNKSKLYGIGVNEMELVDMARWMGCSIREFPFTYLGLPIGENIRRKNAWNPVVSGGGDLGTKVMGYGLRWRWVQVKDGVFKVKELTRLREEKILHVESSGQETISNKLVPKKVNIFVWRDLKCRLSVRVELDRRGIDLDSVLYPSCNNVVESCAHSLVTYDLAMRVWEKLFIWWKLGNVNAFSIDEFFFIIGKR